MKNPSVVLAVAISLFVSASSLAETLSPNYLMFKQLAAEETKKIFLAKLELGRTQSNFARAQFLNEQNEKLRARDKGAVSAFESMDSLMKLMETNFEAKRAAFHLMEAQANKKAWELRLEALRSGKESPKAIATEYAKIAETRFELLKELKAKLVPYLKLLTEEFNRSASLATTGAITKTEFHKITILQGDFLGLQKAVDEEVVTSETYANETRADLENSAD